jgi:putative membrane protein
MRLTLMNAVLFRASFLWAILIVALVGIIGTVSLFWLTKSQISIQNNEATLASLNFYGRVSDSSLIERSGQRTLLSKNKSILPLEALPTFNASLNAISALLLGVGYVFIRQRKITAHKTCMLSAFGLSTLFLLSYATYHYFAGFTSFQGQGWIRSIYFAILIPHIILAAAIVPMALVVLRRGLMRRDLKHMQLARWTLPLWLYTSVTGVIVYFMLYHLS